MDYSKFSDEALEQMSKGKLDYSKLSDSDLENMSSSQDKDNGYGPTADGSLRNPKDVNWLAAIGDALVNGAPSRPGHEPINMSVANNPLLALGPPGLPQVGMLGKAVAGPSPLSPLGKFAQFAKSTVIKQAPEIVKDVATYAAGEAFDQATGNKGFGAGAAIARRGRKFLK